MSELFKIIQKRLESEELNENFNRAINEEANIRKEKMRYKQEFSDALEKVSELAKDFGISELELEHTLIALSQPTPKDVGEMTKELLEKLNGENK